MERDGSRKRGPAYKGRDPDELEVGSSRWTASRVGEMSRVEFFKSETWAVSYFNDKKLFCER